MLDIWISQTKNLFPPNLPICMSHSRTFCSVFNKIYYQTNSDIFYSLWIRQTATSSRVVLCIQRQFCLKRGLAHCTVYILVCHSTHTRSLKCQRTTRVFKRQKQALLKDTMYVLNCDSNSKEACNLQTVLSKNSFM